MMSWLASHGLIQSYADFENLPIGVLEDALMYREAEEAAAKVEAQRAKWRRHG